MQSETHPQPWYKHFWAWFIVALLATSVVLGLSLVTIAVRNQDTLVTDNYYEAGKGINRSLERENLAVRLQVHAKVKVDDLTGEVEVRLTGNSRPDRLTLNLISPTQPEKDRRVELLRSNSDRERYVGQLTDAVEGRRFVELLGQEGSGQWRRFEEEVVSPTVVMELGDEPLQGAEAKRP
ncbi:FixH family protein [Pseudomonas aeruginosa]|nr:FixH family protein [Pseudomonas aeruginosa]MBG4967303.1 FixH family protein [Pseudomonas aeruginosa]MBG7364537.1 FixH family protein [Pseudomonas aeruginosa]